MTKNEEAIDESMNEWVLRPIYTICCLHSLLCVWHRSSDCNNVGQLSGSDLMYRNIIALVEYYIIHETFRAHSRHKEHSHSHTHTHANAKTNEQNFTKLYNTIYLYT